MTVQEFLDYLVTTDLHNLGLTDEETGLIKADKYRLLLGLVKSGLRELYTRFYLGEKITKVYEVHKGSHSLVITDSDDEQGIHPNDLLQVLRVTLLGVKPDTIPMQYLPEVFDVPVLDRTSGLQAMENPDTDMPHYYLSSMDGLHLYSPYELAIYQVTCRVSHGNHKLSLEDRLPLPVAYHNALGLYIAARILRSMDNQLDGDVNESTRYYQAYLQELSMLEMQGISLDRQPQKQYHKFQQKGFI